MAEIGRLGDVQVDDGMTLIDLLAALHERAMITYAPMRGHECGDSSPHFHLIMTVEEEDPETVQSLLKEVDRHTGWITWLLMQRNEEGKEALAARERAIKVS